MKGCPILNLHNQKVIGMLITDSNFLNNGILLKNAFDEFILQYKESFNKKKEINPINIIGNNIGNINDNIHSNFNLNEIRMKIDIKKEEINNNIKLINNLEDENDFDIFLDNIKDKPVKSFRPTKPGIYDITIKFKKYMKSCFRMFSNKTIIDLDLSLFDMRNVTNMEEMFSYCNIINDLDLSFPFESFAPRNVTNMKKMFYSFQIPNLDLSNFDSRNVTNMEGMFEFSKISNNLNLSSFNTKKVTNMKEMFKNFSVGSNNLDLSSFDTKNIINMESMFKEYDLNNLVLTSFDTRNVRDMGFMFYSCKNLNNLDLSSFDTRNVKNMESMFREWYQLQNILFSSSFVTNNVVNMDNIFAYSALTSLDLSYFKIKGNSLNILGGCGALKEVKIKKENKCLQEEILKYTKVKIIFV